MSSYMSTSSVTPSSSSTSIYSFPSPQSPKSLENEPDSPEARTNRAASPTFEALCNLLKTNISKLVNLSGSPSTTTDETEEPTEPFSPIGTISSGVSSSTDNLPHLHIVYTHPFGSGATAASTVFASNQYLDIDSDGDEPISRGDTVVRERSPTEEQIETGSPDPFDTVEAEELTPAERLQSFVNNSNVSDFGNLFPTTEGFTILLKYFWDTNDKKDVVLSFEIDSEKFYLKFVRDTSYNLKMVGYEGCVEKFS